MKGTTIEMIGFLIEASLFVTAGIFALKNMWIAYAFFILALAMAGIVGRQIAKNAIEKYKESHL